MKKLLLFTLCFFPSFLNAQAWWDNFCNRDDYDFIKNSDQIKMVITRSTDLSDRAEAHLVSAWGQYLQNAPADKILSSLSFLTDSVLVQHQRSEAVQNLLRESCFVFRFRELLDSIRHVDYSPHNFSQRQKDDLLARIALAERLLPQYMSTCANVTFDISDDQKSIVFTIKIRDCKAEMDNTGLPRGRIGYPDIYAALADWYENGVLKGLGKTLIAEKDNTTIEIKGLADGYPVTADIQFGQNIVIPRNLEYTYLGPDQIAIPQKLETALNRGIPLSSKSNHFLALARAYLAQQKLKHIASNISLVAQEFNEQGDDFRGVEIRITAYGILDELAHKKLQETKQSFDARYAKINKIDNALNRLEKK